jgi:RNA polymerase sigma factor (sigma-70 family)
VSRPWKGWEYRLLKEHNPVEKAARLLDRSIEEVRQATRKLQATWDDWYRWRRWECGCHGSPESPRRALRLGARICQKDFPALVREDGWERYVFEALDDTLVRFDPARGRQDVPVQERFIQCFCVWLRQRLKKASRRRRGRSIPPEAIARRRQPHHHSDMAERYEWWSRLLFQRALPRLDRRARTCIDLRLQGKAERDIAKRLGVNRKTLSNRYSSTRVVELVRRAVRGLVLDLPAERLRALVCYLLDEGDLSLGQVTRLLCVAEAELQRRLEAAQDGESTGLDREEAVWLLGAA